MLAALVLAQAPIRIGPPDPVLPPTDPATSVALFERLCARPFPDPAAIETAIAAEPGFAHWQPSGELEAMVPGRFWQSAAATVRYNADPASARGLPSPQCTVRANAGATVVPDAVFAAVAGRLTLGQAKVSGRGRYRTAMWDSVHAGQRWRVLAGTERAGDRLELRLTIMNLGAER